MALKALAVDQASDADVLLKKGHGIFGGASAYCTADFTVKIYDSEAVSTVANSRLIGICGSDVSEGGVLQGNISPAEPVHFQRGLVCVVSGANCLATVWYK